MDLPRIRQALFILDKHRNYKFDVNQTITIKNLKRMIIAAANLGKSGLRVFHRGVEYTEEEDSTLNDLFPDMQLVEFTITIVYVEEEEKEQNVKLRLGAYCPLHDFKYPYFYCYDCQKSICSLCVRSADHAGHNFIEKYDYLQSSRNLVESIFHDMNHLLNGAKHENKAEVEELSKRTNSILWPKLYEMLNKIEMKLQDLIGFFLDNLAASFGNIKQNVVLLKDHCAEGLDKLKTEIEIEDMMLDEDIFLTFDRKFRDISSEKIKVVNDAKKYDDLNGSLRVIVGVVETFYHEIYEFLDKYVNHKVYNDVKTAITDNQVGLVNKEDIFARLLSDIKKRGGHSRHPQTEKKPTGVTETPKSGILRAIFKEFETEGKSPRPFIGSSSNVAAASLTKGINIY